MLQTLGNSRPETDLIPLTKHRRNFVQALDPIRFWHLASLDAPTVAVVWSLSFAWAVSIRLPVWFPLLQALVAWAVYVADRLLDARAALGMRRTAPLRDRHYFHWRHRRILLPLAATAAGLAAGIVLLMMPAVAREGDSVLGAAALVYFSGVHAQRRFAHPARRWPFPSKELLVGVLFTAGCVLPAMTSAAPGQFPFLALIAVFFAALAWLNCRAIERWETPLTWFPVFPAACLLSATGLAISFALRQVQPRTGALLAAAAASALLLAVLDRLQARLTPLTLRATADLVLLTPLVFLCR